VLLFFPSNRSRSVLARNTTCPQRMNWSSSFEELPFIFPLPFRPDPSQSNPSRENISPATSAFFRFYTDSALRSPHLCERLTCPIPPLFFSPMTKRRSPLPKVFYFPPIPQFPEFLAGISPPKIALFLPVPLSPPRLLRLFPIAHPSSHPITVPPRLPDRFGISCPPQSVFIEIVVDPIFFRLALFSSPLAPNRGGYERS